MSAEIAEGASVVELVTDDSYPQGHTVFVKRADGVTELRCHPYDEPLWRGLLDTMEALRLADL